MLKLYKSKFAAFLISTVARKVTKALAKKLIKEEIRKILTVNWKKCLERIIRKEYVWRTGMVADLIINVDEESNSENDAT